jgi:hypothetical protein
MNKKVGVWFDSTLMKESDEVYRHILDLGVDFICTDYPLRVAQARDEWSRKFEKHSYIQQSSMLSTSTASSILDSSFLSD